ncbi:NlpC/P60 family protein [Occultella aeris]|uniref:Putative endopeptidase p60 n=1 Tax=Occultella aeris TaxID=2761496 RepID=A0A7M4DHP1_9MICO|nr:C40 family peptidase [Occultella aeris]VZO36434.1 putative endopeptidase p60 precursor [Occultella aeris]
MRARHGRRLVAVLGSVVLAGTLAVGSAAAEPTIPSQDDIDDSQAAADSTASQIATLEVQLATNAAALDAANIDAAVAAEAYNQAAVDLETAQQDADAAQAASDRADADVLAASQEVARIATAAYRNGGDLQQLSVFLSADGVQDAVNGATTFDRLGGSATDALGRLDAAELVADIMQQRADDAVAEQEAATAELEETSDAADAAAFTAQTTLETTQSERGALINELATLRNTTAELEAERQTALEAQQRERENAAAAAAISAPVATPAATPASPVAPTPAAPVTPAPTAPAPSTPAPAPTAPAPAPSTPAPPAPTPTPPTSGSGTGAAALAWALTQVGKPYLLGAEGPNSYDCSGLTMRAYQNAGVSIPRTTTTQYAAVSHVPVGQMRPGDLIFYSDNGSASGIYHVAIYAGDGMRVHAPRPGASVEYVPIWWTNVLPMAGRP